ncbi:MAG: transporter substrate-binding domain-containing protein [Pseudomonadota bacterium]
MSDLVAIVGKMESLLPPRTDEVQNALAPSGILRAGINLSNFLLVTGKTPAGAPDGVSPGMAKALGRILNCDVEYVCFDSPGAVADAAAQERWDIGNIGADPARAEFITFTDAYCEIESTCLVPKGSPIKSFNDVDKPGITIATKQRAAYTLWLERSIKHAELKQFQSIDASFDAFVEQKLDVLAGLKPRLLDDSARLQGSTIISGKFTSVQQAIGTLRKRDMTGAAFLQKFVKAAKIAGLVQCLIDTHGVTGKLSVAS